MKRRDFFKGVSGLIGGLSLFGMGKVKADVKQGAASDMAELRRQNPLYAVTWDKPPRKAKVLEIIVKKSFEPKRGLMRISLRDEGGLLRGKKGLLFQTRLIENAELTKGKRLIFPLPPQVLDSAGLVRINYRWGPYEPRVTQGVIEANIIYSRKLIADS